MKIFVNKKFELSTILFYYESMAKILIGIKVDAELKEILKEAGRDENRSLSNFIKHCLLTYLKEKKGIDYKEDS